MTSPLNTIRETLKNAGALNAWHHFGACRGWVDGPIPAPHEVDAMLRAALAELDKLEAASPAEAPAGFVLVPIEPTDAMLEAWNSLEEGADGRRDWRVMVDARPPVSMPAPTADSSPPADSANPALQHVAVSEGGQLRWMTGRKIEDCELYTYWPNKAPPHDAVPMVAPTAAVVSYVQASDALEYLARGNSAERVKDAKAALYEAMTFIRESAPRAQVVDAPTPQKYDDVLLPFVAAMRAELHANAAKGDRPGWLEMDRQTALLEIYWHVAKLSASVKNYDPALIREHSADVANMAMMLCDVCGELPALAAPPSAPAATPDTDWIDRVQLVLTRWSRRGTKAHAETFTDTAMDLLTEATRLWPFAWPANDIAQLRKEAEQSRRHATATQPQANKGQGS